MRLKMYGHSDIGKVRKGNQDSYFCDGVLGLAIVADGIGGRKGGEVASSLVVRSLKESVLNAELLRQEEVSAFLLAAVDKANQTVLRRGEKEAKIKGMGTTLNCAMFVGDHIHLAHIGDSRTYLYYKKEMWQLTIDHNIETYVRRGWMHPQQVQPGTRQEALVRSIGLSGRCESDIYTKKLQAGEIYITCSDGLNGMVSDRSIADIVSRNEKNIEALPELLIKEANRKGGKDNTTVVITQVKG